MPFYYNSSICLLWKKLKTDMQKKEKKNHLNSITRKELLIKDLKHILPDSQSYIRTCTYIIDMHADIYIHICVQIFTTVKS